MSSSARNRENYLRSFGDHASNIWIKAQRENRLVQLPQDITAQLLMRDFAKEFLGGTFPLAAKVTFLKWLVFNVAQLKEFSHKTYGWVIHQATPTDNTMYLIASNNDGVAKPLLIVSAQMTQKDALIENSPVTVVDGFFHLSNS